MKKTILLAALILGLISPLTVGAQSTLNPLYPETEDDITSYGLREQFLSIYTEINALFNQVNLPSIGANQLLMALTAGVPTGVTVHNCNTSNSALTFTQGSGFGCNNIAGSGLGTVTSVSLTGDGVIFSATPSTPVTAAGTLTPMLLPQSGNMVLAGAANGSIGIPLFRYLIGEDIPLPTASTRGGVQSSAVVADQFVTGISTSGVVTKSQPSFLNVSGNISVSQMNSGTGASSSTCWRGDGTWVNCSGGGGSSALSSLTSATTTNSIENSGNTQTWNWGSLASATGLALSGTTSSSGKLLSSTVTGNNTGYAGYFSNSMSSGYAVYANGQIGSSVAIKVPSGGTGQDSTWVPSGAGRIFAFGDSFTAATLGASSCVSGNSFGNQISPGSATGTCWVDMMAVHFNMPVINYGYNGAPMEHCVTSTTDGCTHSGIDVYASELVANMTPNDYVIITFGINDGNYQVGTGGGTTPGEPTFTPANFRANYSTIVAALINAGIPRSHIAVGVEGWRPVSMGRSRPQEASQLDFYAGAALAAMDNGVPVIDFYHALAMGGWNGSTWLQNYQLYDNTVGHPNNNGNKFEANAVFNPTILTPLQAWASYSAQASISSLVNQQGLGVYYPVQDTYPASSISIGYTSLPNSSGGNAPLFGLCPNSFGTYQDIGIGLNVMGATACRMTTAAVRNVGVGVNAIQFLTSGADSTAIGTNAGGAISSGLKNTAIGSSAMAGSSSSQISGSENTGVGYSALAAIITTGNQNSAVGAQALGSLTTGAGNVAVGYRAGFSGTAVTVGTNNTLLGFQAQVDSATSTNRTAVGNAAASLSDNDVTLGNGSVSSIHAAVTSITAISDGRLKKDIAPLDLGLDFIMGLKPVSYDKINGDQTIRFGFIAQETERALPEKYKSLIGSPSTKKRIALIEKADDEKHTYSMTYGELTAPLVKAIQEQQAEIIRLKKAVNAQPCFFGLLLCPIEK